LDKSLVKRINEAFTMSIVEPDLVERLKQYGIEPAPSSPEDLADRLRKERDQFARVIKAAGIRLE
jgi:tripartite-type tricarboxylate transporter receptor subunit TctC